MRPGFLRSLMRASRVRYPPLRIVEFQSPLILTSARAMPNCTAEVWPVTPPNARRLGSIVREPNFGLIEVDWNAAVPRLRLQARAADGRVRIEQALDTRELAVPR